MKRFDLRRLMPAGAVILTVILACCTIFILTSLSNGESNPVELTKQGIELNKTSRFLAGLLTQKELDFLPEKERIRYMKISESITKSWNGFFTRNKKEIITWRDANIPEKDIIRVFYPFSGPDVLHPLAFFPKADEILMFGLEPTGGIPSMAAIPASALVYHTESLLEAVNFVLNHSFFVTSDMSIKVKRNSLNGVGAVICFFLARDGYAVLDAREIFIQPDGIIGYDVKNAKPARDLVYGIEILFMGADKKHRRATYFQIDVFNKSPQLERFSAMIDIFNPQAAIIKSASYLMSDKNFSRIRDIVLTHSPMVIQDDSGVSYAFFKKTEWDISYYGKYHKPIPVFQYQYQKYLEADVAKYSKGPINFVYGYGYGYPDMTYHLIVARKKQKP